MCLSSAVGLSWLLPRWPGLPIDSEVGAEQQLPARLGQHGSPTTADSLCALLCSHPIHSTFFLSCWVGVHHVCIEPAFPSARQHRAMYNMAPSRAAEAAVWYADDCLPEAITQRACRRSARLGKSPARRWRNRSGRPPQRSRNRSFLAGLAQWHRHARDPPHPWLLSMCNTPSVALTLNLIPALALPVVLCWLPSTGGTTGHTEPTKTCE